MFGLYPGHDCTAAKPWRENYHSGKTNSSEKLFPIFESRCEQQQRDLLTLSTKAMQHREND